MTAPQDWRGHESPLTAPGRGSPALWYGIDAALSALGLYFLMTFLFLAWRHAPYPFELEWMEGGILDHVHRLLQGKALYAAPSLEFTAFSYAPLYYYLASALARIFGLNLLTLRAISIAAALGTVMLTSQWAFRECKSWRAGVLAGTLYLASYPLSGCWFDLARVDSLFLLLLLSGFFVLRFSRTSFGAFLAALLLALAFFTKQTALIITLPVLIYILWSESRTRRRIFLISYFLLMAGGFWVLQNTSSGWFSYYLFYLPDQHPPVYWRIHHFWIDYFVKPLPLALLIGMAFLLLGGLQRSWPDRYWLFLTAGMAGGPWLACIPSGAYHNVAMPAHAIFALLFALGIHHWQRGQPWLWALALLQLLLLLYNPLNYLPDPADRKRGEELVCRIAEAPAPVWIPSHGYLARMAGKEGCAHRCALDDVLRGVDEPGKLGLLREIEEALTSRKYAVIIANDEWLALDILKGYTTGQQIFACEKCFHPLTGWQTRPQTWYEREK